MHAFLIKNAVPGLQGDNRALEPTNHPRKHTEPRDSDERAQIIIN